MTSSFATGTKAEISGDEMKVLIINGSVREESYTRCLAHSIRERLEMAGAAVDVWDLAERPLPIADPAFHRDPSKHSELVVRELVAVADKSDAFVLSSPVYHNSFSGVLKNCLDHLAIRQFAYKAVGLTSQGGNRTTQVVDPLRIVMRGLLAVAIPTQICTSQEDFQSANDGSFRISNEAMVERVNRFASELVIFSEHCKEIRSTLLA